jgi:flagellar hook-associated protein 3 FlgL
MRVTLGSLTLNFLRNLNAGLERLAELQQRLATGKRMQRPSDDPTNLPPVLVMRDALRAAEQYGRNAQDTATLLGAGQQALLDATGVLQRVRELALQASNGTLSASDLQTVRAEVSNLLDELVALGNTQVAGRYLFAGTATTTAPFVRTGDAVAYVGNSGALLREVDRGVVLAASVPGDAALGATFAAVTDVLTALASGDPAAVRAELPNLDSALDVLLQAQADLGARANRVDVLQQRWSEFAVQMRGLLSVREDADMAEVVMELRLRENTYQAALAAGARLLQPSLVDFLR